jgi:hypothetical protein
MNLICESLAIGAMIEFETAPEVLSYFLGNYSKEGRERRK